MNEEPHAGDRWTSPRTIIGVCLMAVLGATVAAVFWFHDPQTVSQTVGGVFALAGAAVGWYFGSSAAAERKDKQP